MNVHSATTDAETTPASRAPRAVGAVFTGQPVDLAPPACAQIAATGPVRHPLRPICMRG